MCLWAHTNDENDKNAGVLYSCVFIFECMHCFFHGQASSPTCPACARVKVLIFTCVRFCVRRCEVELSTVPVNQRRLFTLTLNPGRGVLVFLLAVNTCSGVTISDICAAPLDQPQERQNQLDNYVSTFTTAENVFASARFGRI